MSGDAFTGEVTPADLRQALEDAIAAGGDRERLEREYARHVKIAGSEEALAARWTTQNLLESYRQEMRKPATPTRATAPRSESDIQRLKELVRLYPELARSLAAKLPDEPSKPGKASKPGGGKGK